MTPATHRLGASEAFRLWRRRSVRNVHEGQEHLRVHVLEKPLEVMTLETFSKGDALRDILPFGTCTRGR